jgi:hypothetical protein
MLNDTARNSLFQKSIGVAVGSIATQALDGITVLDVGTGRHTTQVYLHSPTDEETSYGMTHKK